MAATFAPVPLKTRKARRRSPKWSRKALLAPRRCRRRRRRRRRGRRWRRRSPRAPRGGRRSGCRWRTRAGASRHGWSDSRLPFIFAAASEKTKAIASAMSSAEVKRRVLLVRVLLAHPRGEDRVDDDHVGGRPGVREGVGEGQRPGLGRGLGGGVGGVGARRGSAPGRRRRGRSGRGRSPPGHRRRRGWRAGRCGRGGRGATRSRRAAPRRAARRPSSRRPGGARASTPPKRSTAARRPIRAPPPRRAGRRRGRPSGPRRSPSSVASASSRSWARSSQAIVAPASARRLATTGPSPPAAPAIAITRSFSSAMTDSLLSRGLRRTFRSRCSIRHSVENSATGLERVGGAGQAGSSFRGAGRRRG